MDGLEWGKMPADVRQEYLKIIRRIPPSKRMEAAAQLSDMVRDMMAAGIRATNPGISDEDVFKEIVKRTLPAGWTVPAFAVAPRTVPARLN